MPQPSDETRSINVDYLARVEGEGSMKVEIRNGQAEITEFGIFEPPRFFEAFMRGRLHTEAPDITARICGICPVAYQMSSAHAMEQAMGIQVGGQLRELRRLLYCGASGSKATCCTPGCSTHPTSSGTRVPSTWPRSIAQRSNWS